MIAFGRKWFISFCDTENCPIIYHENGSSSCLSESINQQLKAIANSVLDKWNNQLAGDLTDDFSNDKPDVVDFELGCVQVSPSEKLLAICPSSKALVIFNVNNWTVNKIFLLERKAKQIIFTGNEQKLIVNNRSGDVFMFDLSMVNYSKGQFLLGHNSIILDMMFDPNENFLITCDRDEKIRVTNFPNCYNIQSYCLQHTEFVSCIAFLTTRLMLSGGGDGTIRLWDFKKGDQIAHHTCNGDLNSCPEKMAIRKIHPYTSENFAVTFYKSKDVVFYSFANDKINYEFCIDFHSEIIESHLNGEFLFVFTVDSSEFTRCYSLTQNPPMKVNHPLVQSLNKNNKIIESFSKTQQQENDIGWLYKKYYDNISDYYKRKKEREEGDIEEKKRLLPSV